MINVVRNKKWLFLLMSLFISSIVVCAQTTITDVSGLNAMTANGNYVITADIDAAGYNPTLNTAFTGTLTAQAKADGTFPVISGLTRPLFSTVTDANISNIPQL